MFVKAILGVFLRFPSDNIFSLFSINNFEKIRLFSEKVIKHAIVIQRIIHGTIAKINNNVFVKASLGYFEGFLQIIYVLHFQPKI